RACPVAAAPCSSAWPTCRVAAGARTTATAMTMAMVRPSPFRASWAARTTSKPRSAGVGPRLLPFGSGSAMKAHRARTGRQEPAVTGREPDTRGRRMTRSRFVLTAAAIVMGPGAMLVATHASAQALVQPAPAVPAGQTLNAALGRLARDPRDLAALIDAGNAALQMGDVDAAIGFFARADQLSPNNMRVKAGLAGALVRSENPYDAIPLFAEAERAGAVDPVLAVDRGLAYDLVGDNASAQRYYRQALAAGPNDEAVRRLALSQAIAGDRKGMEATLSPLLQRQDKGAWRARAFALA